MKILAPLLLLVLLFSACSKAPPVKVGPKPARGFPPVHTNLEVFVVNYAVSEHRGSRAHPNLAGLKLDDRYRKTFGCSAGDAGGPDYGASIEYKGTEGDRDYYFVTITAPSEAVGLPAPHEVAYEGQEIELWRDSQWRIGMCPRGKRGEQGE